MGHAVAEGPKSGICGMRELFEISTGNNPLDAARRGTRPALRRRFYSTAAPVCVAAGHEVHLDGKPVNTPARRRLFVPTRSLVQLIADEWNAQHDVIDPARMPVTRLANAIIDGVTLAPEKVAADIARYVASDLLFYRAEEPQALRDRQAQHWDPILVWLGTEYGANFRSGDGIAYVAQPDEALVTIRDLIPSDPWRLGPLHVLTTATGSALLALAVALGKIAPPTAWQAAYVDEDWNMEQWGRDEIALQRRASHFADFEAAAMMLATLD